MTTLNMAPSSSASTAMPHIRAVCLIPASGEYVYDTTPFSGCMGGGALQPINCWAEPGSGRTDMMVSLDDLQASLPDCAFVALVVQWMGDSLDASQCRVYPSSTFIGGSLTPSAGGSETWRVSDLLLTTPGLIPISRPDGVHAAYGGTPSDASIVRAIRELKGRGLKVALYLQMNMDLPGRPWRGLCTLSPDRSEAATAAVTRFVGAATSSMFTPDADNLTAHYAGSALDFTFRRFVLHYACLCTVAGGVNLFTIGSELRGLESIRGPSWTLAGGRDASGAAVWDYPFVAALISLLADCRAMFDGAGLTKNIANRNNLLCYAPDWSQWTGAQHSDSSGIFPHLDPLWASADCDLVMFDNYLPLSDWTTDGGGLDAQNWRAPPPSGWPTPLPESLGFGLDGAPQIYDLRYLQANIERGERCDYWYADSDVENGFDPGGPALTVVRPSSDRAAQARQRYYPGQELFAFKNIRWWWSNVHRAVYDAGDGQGVAPHGPPTAWVPQSKSIGFMEYGFPSIDRCTNEENVFYDPTSTSGGAPYWSVFEQTEGMGLRPRRDDTLQYLAHQAVRQYWDAPGVNPVSASGASMIATDMMFAWTWDARPFPLFPRRLDLWADGGNWRAGHWLNGKGPALPPPPPDALAPPASPPIFPSLVKLSWSVVIRPRFSGLVGAHASGREVRRLRASMPLFEVEASFETPSVDDARALIGFFETLEGAASPFFFPAPAELGVGPTILCRFADDFVDVEEFMTHVFDVRRLRFVGLRA